MAKARKPKKPDHIKQTLTALESGDIPKVREILSGLHPADIANLLVAIPLEPRSILGAD